MTGERKKEQAPEVRAAGERFEGILRALLEAVESRQPKVVVEAFARSVGEWAGVVLNSDDVRAAFWGKVRRDVDFWQVAVKKDLDDRNLVGAIISARNLVDVLVSYTNLLGLGVPPEEEEVPAAEVPSAPAEVKPVKEPTVEPPVKEGTSLRVLGLPNRVYNALCRSKPLLKLLDLRVVDPEGEETTKRKPYVEEIVGVLEREGEEFLLTPGTYFGPESLKELKAALRAKGFLPPEEAKPTEEPLPVEYHW